MLRRSYPSFALDILASDPSFVLRILASFFAPYSFASFRRVHELVRLGHHAHTGLPTPHAATLRRQELRHPYIIAAVAPLTGQVGTSAFIFAFVFLLFFSFNFTIDPANAFIGYSLADNTSSNEKCRPITSVVFLFTVLFRWSCV